MDVGRAYGYVFDDDNWIVKVLIGGLLNLIPIVSLVTTGYALRALRNVADGRELPLPEWSDFGDYFVRGLLVALAALIYGIPLGLLIILSLGFFGLNGDRGAGPLALCGTGLACLASVYFVLLLLWFPAAVARFALAGDLGAFFRFDEIGRFITRDTGAYIVALLAALLASLIAGIVGGILCGVGVAFASFWAGLVFAHLFGQVARASAGPAPTG
ncbi:MAG: DUF4013 domain-containing protein [Anaerolineae bacterium]|nr:DUF4013 domain-containing protein [Anaerolineae bacterium]